MMKKYNKPEIETLALETVDVIETSGTKAAIDALGQQTTIASVQTIQEEISSMQNTWSW